MSTVDPRVAAAAAMISQRPRIVIVGNGMAGSRLVEEIRSRDPHRMLHITAFGAENHGAYNRVLLSEVLAGRHHPDDIRLAGPGSDDGQVDVRLGVPVVAVDRARREVRAADGSVTPYDVLVLATGSQARIPPLDGLADGSGALLPGGFVFRTLDDCREILAAAAGAHRAVVLGGGLLGLEAARGLAGQGLDVVVVHQFGHLMERQLDPMAGRVLAHTLRVQGVQVRLGAASTAVVRDATGRFGGIRLDDGSCVLADLLVVACGVVPEVTLARAAGLSVDRGVVVDDVLRSVSDPRVFALGECAQHSGQVYGLVAPAWEQATVVAAHITGSDPGARYAGSRTVTRLRAVGVDLAAMGETTLGDDDAAEVVQFADPTRGTYAKMVIRDERLVGAILVGEMSTVGTVTQLFDRGAPVPADRTSLLFGPRRGGQVTTSVAAPGQMPSHATLCRCNGVTKGAIQECVLAGARTVEAVAQATRATTGCGGCRDVVEGIIEWVAAADPDTAPAVPA